MTEYNTCPEIPFFGAGYPDATCIEGYLWDLDSCDEPGGDLYRGGEIECPFCNRAKYIESAVATVAEDLIVNNWDDKKDQSKITEQQAKQEAFEMVNSFINMLDEKYGAKS